MPLFAMLVLAAQAGGATVDGTTPLQRRPSSSLCVGVRVIAPNLERQPRDLVFSGRQVLDLQFQARLRDDVTGDHLMRFKVTTPGGFLYQVIAVPFAGAAPRGSGGAIRMDAGATGSPPAAATRVVPGYPRPLPVQTLAPVEVDGARHYAVSARLPVAGTSITQSSLYGRWTVESYLDDGKEPCGSATRFTIRE
jgi:hypothetical protein